MKIRPVFIVAGFVAMVAVTPTRAETPRAELAAEASAKGDWKTAIDLYRQILPEGAADPALLYNLGTAYAHAGERGRAVWMLLKARRLAPRDHEIRNNLRLLAPDLDSQIAVFPLAPVQGLYDALSLNEWALLAGFATIVAGALLAVVFSRPRESASRALMHRLATVAVILAAVTHHFAAFKYYEEAYSSRGVVVAENTAPRPEPNEASQPYDFVLPPGTVIRVANAGVRGWVKAIYGGGNEVFIRRDQMEFL